MEETKSTRRQTLPIGGSSADGRGDGKYIGRTTDPVVAKAHAKKCEKNPYSTGYVLRVDDETQGKL